MGSQHLEFSKEDIAISDRFRYVSRKVLKSVTAEGLTTYCGLNCISPNLDVEILTPATPNVAVFGDRASKMV